MHSLFESFRKYNFVRFDLRGEIPEVEEKGFLPFLGGKKRLAVGEIEKILSAIEASDEILGVLVVISELRIGLARANSLRRCLLGLRRRGKRVFVYIESGGNIEYLIGSAGEYIFIPQWAMLNLVGLSAEVTFYKDILDKLGISARLKGYGEYKSAAEAFTRGTMSPPHREMVDSIIRNLETQFEEAVSEGRGVRIKDVRAVIDRGPFVPASALGEGLVDCIAYEHEIEDRVSEAVGVKVRTITARNLYRLLKIKESLGSIVGNLRGRGGVIAVLTDTGIVTLGESMGRGGVRTMGSGSLLSILERLSRDRGIKGLVLRILTPGGSGVASDLIRKSLKRISEKMPVVVSMSDVSASGGYLIALGAHRIVADPMTLTGSIGIVSGKFDLAEFYGKLGVKKELIPVGKRSLMFSASRDFSEEEGEKLDELMRFYYSEFVGAVSEGRGLGRDEAEKAAKGRVWTGAQAKELGLVDELGGFGDAVAIAAREAGLPGGRMPRLRFYAPDRGVRLASVLGGSAYSDLLKTVVENLTLPGCEGCIAIMPFRINVR